MSSQFNRYWQRIDNTPGSLEVATPEQIREVKEMVRTAFHHVPHNRRDENKQLRAENKRLQAAYDKQHQNLSRVHDELVLATDKIDAVRAVPAQLERDFGDTPFAAVAQRCIDLLQAILED